jgi:hypothetical protein
MCCWREKGTPFNNGGAVECADGMGVLNGWHSPGLVVEP